MLIFHCAHLFSMTGRRIQKKVCQRQINQYWWCVDLETMVEMAWFVQDTSSCLYVSVLFKVNHIFSFVC